MRVEIKEVAVLTDGDGKERLVWDSGFIGMVRSLGVTGVTLRDEKDRSQGRKPAPSPQRAAKDMPRHNGYGTRECASCHEMFAPRSGRAKVCDACRKAGVLRKRPAADKGQTNPAMAEVRKLAAATNLGPYCKGRDGDAS